MGTESSDGSSVWGMGGGGWRTVGVAGGAAGTAMSVEGYRMMGKAALDGANRSVTALRRTAYGKRSALAVAGLRAQKDADNILSNYRMEAALRSDKAQRDTAVISSRLATGMSVDSDTYHAILEDQASQNASAEALHRAEASQRYVASRARAEDALVEERNVALEADYEAVELMRQGREQKIMYDLQAVGSAIKGVTSIAGMFA